MEKKRKRFGIISKSLNLQDDLMNEQSSSISFADDENFQKMRMTALFNDRVIKKPHNGSTTSIVLQKMNSTALQQMNK